MLTMLNIKKIFNQGTPDERIVFNDFSLQVEKGEFITLVGGNGSGKSTLFNLISGILLPDSGNITLNDLDITTMLEHKRAHMIGRIFQDPLKGTAPHMTVEENLSIAYMRSTKRSLFSRISKKDKVYLQERVAQLGLGLEDRMQAQVGLLSGGQRQAMTMSMATITTPKLLLLDEHTAALDPVSAEKVMNLTRKIVSELGITTIMITHNISSAIETGNRIIMLDSGRIVVDIKGEKRDKLTKQELLNCFSESSEKEFDSEQILQ
ncbi:MAG: ABC transporter ATP-binding protein [Firmicutes bacterium HGW-Firmicutes-12]|jgi:putative ABC transport system ATP-binding protein|nr:MAG: ABC transporter ATP-binding protein [Firmicutes bacterium HGW-Firmicutes-12]